MTERHTLDCLVYHNNGICDCPGFNGNPPSPNTVHPKSEGEEGDPMRGYRRMCQLDGRTCPHHPQPQEQAGQQDALKQEMLSCPYCLGTSHSGSPEYYALWRIKHHFHPNL